MQKERLRFWLDLCCRYGEITDELCYLGKETESSANMAYLIWHKISAAVMTSFLRDAGIQWKPQDDELPVFEREGDSFSCPGWDDEDCDLYEYWWSDYSLTCYENEVQSPLQSAMEALLHALEKRYPKEIVFFDDPLEEYISFIDKHMPEDRQLTTEKVKALAKDYNACPLRNLFSQSVGHYGMSFEDFLDKALPEDGKAVLTLDMLYDNACSIASSQEARCWVGFPHVFVRVPDMRSDLSGVFLRFLNSVTESWDYMQVVVDGKQYLRLPMADAFSEYTASWSIANITSPFLWIFIWLMFEPDFSEALAELGEDKQESATADAA